MKRAYSVTELLVVIAIIAILAALLFPALVGAKTEAKKTVCVSNLHQIYLAAKLYQADNDTYPYSTNEPSFRAYYKTVLTCPQSKNLSRPTLRVFDYLLVGKPVPASQPAFEKCQAIRGTALPLVLDANHIQSLIQPNDTTSRYLVVREDGSYQSVLAAPVTYGKKTCDFQSLPYWYNL